MQSSNERWLPVSGWEGYYEVSDYGRVRSVERVLNRSNGRKYTVRQQVMATFREPKNHIVVTLNRDGKKSGVNRLVHQLVLEAFVGPRPDGLVACHRDDDPDNNHVSNLRWGTYSDNTYDQIRNGIHNNARKTHCKNNHEFSSENTRYTKSGGRVCRTCEYLRRKRWRENRRAQGLPVT